MIGSTKLEGESKMIRHIFSDMDGTLLNSKGQISENNVKGIRGSGIPFTLVSARAPMEMAETIAKLKLTDPQIGFNGGLIFQNSSQGIKIIKDEPLALSDVKKLIQVVKTQFPKISCSCYDLHNWYSEKIDAGTKFETSVTKKLPKLVDYQNLFVKQDRFYKVMLITFDLDEMDQLIAVLNKLNLPNVSIKRSGDNYLEITSHKAQKSSGIKYIQELKKLARAEMAAFGDGHNDLPMLKAVGTPIVMKNAMEDIKNYGKYITKTNDEDGVSFGITKYLDVNVE